MTAPSRLDRYLRTTVHLSSQQIVTRVRLRGQRALFARFPVAWAAMHRARPVDGDWPLWFMPFDGRVPSPDIAWDELCAGRITLLGHTRALRSSGRGSVSIDWTQADAPLLWRYHLHYWDWAWIFIQADAPTWSRRIFADLYLSWRTTNPVGQGVAWSPYVASLRAWTLCGLAPRLAPGTDIGRAIRKDLGFHRSFLRRHLETDVKGNHLLKNLKALIGLAVASGDRAECGRWLSMLRREIRRQILSDGGHYERAPAYHCQVLADLDDLVRLLTAAGIPVPDELPTAASAMRRWLSVVLGPDGTVPLLNDGYPVTSAALADLLGDKHRAPSPVPEQSGARPFQARLLADSGLAVMTAGDWHVLADIGPTCPDELPAHAHSDTFSFLLWHRCVPVLVDTGTSTYEPGGVRDSERGSAAHSTLVVDEENSTDVWGAFRTGRRARPHLVGMASGPERVELTAWHDGYRHLPGRPTHQRTWRIGPDGTSLIDRVGGSGRHSIEILFQFAPGVDVCVDPPDGPGAGRLRITLPDGEAMALRADGAGVWRLYRRPRAIGWRRVQVATSVGYRIEGDLPIEVRSVLTLFPTSRSAPASQRLPIETPNPRAVQSGILDSTDHHVLPITDPQVDLAVAPSPGGLS